MNPFAANLFLGGDLESTYYWTLAAVAGLVFLPFLILPPLVRFTTKVRRSPTILTFDPDDRPAPAWVQEYLDDTEAALWGCGFEVIEHVALPDLMPNVKAIFVLMTRPESNDAAVAVAMFGTGNAATVRKYHVGISTKYADGFEHATVNNPEESVYKPLPHKRMIYLDFIKDPAALWRIHERAVQEFGTGPKRAVPTKSDAITRLREGLLEESEEQVAVDWLFYDEGADAFRPTWKGACLMAWKLCWPVSTLRRTSRRKHAKRLLEEWDMRDTV